MEVAATVIAVGLLGGVAAGVVTFLSRRAHPEDPHVEQSTIRAYLDRHPVVERLAGGLPQGRGGAFAGGLAIALLVVIGTAVVTGIFLLMVRSDSGLVRIDLPIARWAADNATDTSTTIMRELSKFGGTLYVVVGAIAITAIALVRDRRWAVPLFVFVTMIGQFLVSNSIKWSVERARPDLSNLTGFSGSSFPSGHAVAGAAAWTCVALLLSRGRSRTVRSVLFGIAIALGIIVAGTRVALGVHWTTDVTIGLVIGWAWFAVCALLFGGSSLEPAEPIETAAEAAESGPASAD